MLSWPTAPALHPDTYALDILFDLLTDGKETPLHAVLVDEKKLTSAKASYARTPSTFDRTVEPPYGSRPDVKLPAVWQASFDNGLKVYGIRDEELPIAQFELAIEGGRLLDDLDKPGAANLLSRMLMRGTARRTPAELEDALKSLGADISISARNEHIVLQGRTLARNFGKTIDLVEEILLEPRWDPEELALQKAAVVSAIQASRTQPNSLAARLFDYATYGDKHIYSRNALGSEKSVAALTMDDLKRFHAEKLAPNVASFRIVGAVDQGTVKSALGDLGSRWARREVEIPSYPAPSTPEKSRILFYDLPGAKQSIFAFGYPALKRAEADYYPANVMNYILGGGGFASRLTQQLREGKGYTYGIGSGFGGGIRHGTFQIGSGVRSNVTLEAAELTRSILAEYGSTFTAADLEVTKSFLTKSRSRAFETTGAKLAYLAALADYGLPADYPQREQAIVDAMTVEQVKALAGRYVRPGAMTYVIVGDAATQAKRLEALGLGAPVIVNEELARLEK